MHGLRRIAGPRRRGAASRFPFLVLWLAALLVGSTGLAGPGGGEVAPPPAPPAPPSLPPMAHPDSCQRCYVNSHLLYTLRGLKAESEAVQLRHGVGIFYTATRDRTVDALQELVEETIETLQEINEDPTEAHLCAFCLGQYHWQSQLEHEVIHTSHGSLVLITSRNPKALEAVRKWYGRYQTGYDFEEMRRELEKMREEMRKDLEKMPVKGGR